MVAGVVFVAYIAVHAGFYHSDGNRVAEKEMVQPQAMIAFKAIAPIRPERIHPLVSKDIAQRVSPAIR